MMRQSLRVNVVLLAASLVVVGPSFAQNPAAVVTGVVLDSTGGVIVGATVGLRLKDALERRDTTDRAGRFTFYNVPRAPGALLVTADMFAAMMVDIDGPGADLRVVLEPLPITEQVTVLAPGPAPNRLATAMKTEVALREVPQAVTIVSRDQIAEQGMQSLADVVRYVPGVGMAQGEGNRDAAVFRGNSSTSDFFIDGVRDDVQFFRDLYNVERVEALKGPNAMIFGRGGVGGVINRVTREAGWNQTREFTAQIGSWGDRRFSVDLGQGFSDRVAVRVTGVYENADSYRDGVTMERQGLNPTIAFSLGMASTFRIGYEHFEDVRTADRGIPSFGGRPVETAPSTFFGDPAASTSDVAVDAVSALYERGFRNGVTLRNRTRYADYDKFYQNVFPGAVGAGGTTVSMSAYNDATGRQNLFNQTDVIVTGRAVGARHTLVGGAELGRQVTDNRRLIGVFSNVGPTTTALTIPISSPTVRTAVTFGSSATSADSHGVATVAAFYAQDQVEVTTRVQAVVGLRYDSFSVDFRNNRDGSELASRDGLLSPRVGVIVTPVAPVSIYGSYTLSYLPRSGEQLTSLTVSSRELEPERFRNYEIGATWDIRPALALSAAVYRLNRGNVAVPDPVNPALSLLVEGQRTRGVEVGLSGFVSEQWSVMGAYAYQDGQITRTLSSTVLAGSRLAHLPEHTFSLWNRYDVSSRLGAGVGILHRGGMFTSTDNAVVLPSFTRVDAALFLRLHRRVHAQVNAENLFDARYYASAHNNNNITPGSPRAIRVTLSTGF